MKYINPAFRIISKLIPRKNINKIYYKFISANKKFINLPIRKGYVKT